VPEDVFAPTTGIFATDKMVRDWLRKPFKPEQIGRIPASKGRPALDFVGHAAVTDRLNRIAPDWTYTVDNMSSIGDQVWIRGTMTIGGISRPEFGDGADPKEAIGNFIRRGAMRFGVAIDLWSREELEASPAAGPAQAVTPSAGVATKGEAALASTGPSPAGETVPPTGTTERLGEGRSDPVGGASSAPLAGDSADTASAGTEDVSSLKPPHPVPATRTFPVDPAACDHKTQAGRWVKWVRWENVSSDGTEIVPNGTPGSREVCPKCGTPKLIAMESTNADLGAA
jgi:hypothetical protein